MKFLYTKQGGCGNHTHTITVYEGELDPCNPKISTDFTLEEGHYEAKILDSDDENDIGDSERIDKYLKELLKEYGPNPSYDQMEKVYNLIFDVFRGENRYVSKYKSEINDIIEKYRPIPNTREFVIQCSGNDIESLHPGMKIYVTKINNGYECMTHSVILSLFDNQKDAQKFEEKVKDVLKDFSSYEYEWCNLMSETHVLCDDLKTFKIEYR
jgi:hypothetical protein